MTQFWKWLSRANARAALLAAVIAFFVVAAYWIWSELNSAEAPAPFPVGLTGMAPAVSNRVELLAYIRVQQRNGEKAMNNPFFRRPVSKPQNPPSNPQPKPDTQADPQPRPNPPVSLPPPPPPRETPVLFRGIMTRTDGSLMALIENQDTRQQKFYRTGQPFLDARVEGIGAESVTLRRPDGGAVTLPRGQVVKIREKK